MKIGELPNAPQWLLDAKTENADVEWVGSILTWKGGTWNDPIIKNRLLYHAAMLGIVFDETGYATAYRTTINGHGRHITNFIQPSGWVRDAYAFPAGSGTCVPGTHVTSMAIAMTYFGLDERAELWRCRFKRENLLDCDGEKARINYYYAEKIDCPFMAK